MSTSKKLEDFGEHIAGAKKEIYFRVVDLSDEETKKLPLSKLWADKDIMAIEDLKISTIAYALKNDLPNKPRQERKLNDWLIDLQSRQEFILDLLEKNDQNYTIQKIDSLKNDKVKNKYYLLSQLEKDTWKSIGNLYFYQKVNLDTVHFEVVINNKAHTFIPKEPISIHDYNSKKIINEFSQEIQKQIEQNKQEKSQNNTKIKELTAKNFDIYTYKRDNTAFICSKNDRQRTPLIKFETLTEAREYKKDIENIAELSRRWTIHREQNSITKTDMRNRENQARTGQSYRDHDITPDEFMDTFGIRGGQFGNWVTGDERQKMLNATYDGFMDLSKALNIEPKAIGLNGTLGITFGARGSGNASAHYEANEKVINLTKTRGVGSLAHEWWHALDHYMANSDNLLTQRLNDDDIARHQELVIPVHELIKNIHKSELYSRSQTADAYRSKPYFATDVEMTARAFEGHIQHTLSKIGIKNDFLVNIKTEKDWQKNLDAYPYPKAEELKSFDKAYNTIFDTLKQVDKQFTSKTYEAETLIHAETIKSVGLESDEQSNLAQAQTKHDNTPKDTEHEEWEVKYGDLTADEYYLEVLNDELGYKKHLQEVAKNKHIQGQAKLVYQKSVKDRFYALPQEAQNEIITSLEKSLMQGNNTYNQSIWQLSQSDTLFEEMDRNIEYHLDAYEGKNWDRFSARNAINKAERYLRHINKDFDNVKKIRTANSFEETRQKAAEFTNKELVNYHDGHMAIISKRAIDKMLSGKANEKLVDLKTHLIAVSNADKLFENSVYGWSEPHRNGSPDILAIHRAFAPLKLENEIYLTKLTIKEMADNQGGRVYSLEALEVGREKSLVPDLTEEYYKNVTPHRLNKALIDILVQNIQEYNRQYEKNTSILQNNFMEGTTPNNQSNINKTNETLAITIQEVQEKLNQEQPANTTNPSQKTPHIAQQNTYINCPYAQKDQAKALGARWDSANKSWYAPAGLDLNNFEKWLVPEKEKITENLTITPIQQNKTYLYTQPSDIEAIRKLKADNLVKFDVSHKVWYTHEPNNPQIKQWLHPAHVPSAEEAFAEYLQTSGIHLDDGHPIADGRPHRLANEGSNNKNVMYQLYPNHGGIPAGRIINFSRGGTPEKWTYPKEYIAILKNIEAVDNAKGLVKPTPSITTSHIKKTDSAQEQIQSPRIHKVTPKQQAAYDKTAQRVQKVMSFAPLANQHEYLSKKQVTSNNLVRIVPDKSQLPPQFANDIVIANDWHEAQLLKNQGDNRMILQKGNLMIPQFNTQGELRSLENIGYQGAKYALKGGERNGLSLTLGQIKNGEPVILAEGYATGATLHEQTGKAVVVTFGKGGLLNIAQQLREHYPESKIYIGADNDHSKAKNVGLLDAQKVAQIVTNTYVVIPQFEAGDKGKDWNDIYVDKGVDEFKRQLKQQLNQINLLKEQSKTTQYIHHKPTIQELLTTNSIKQNYPQISDDNLQAIKVWKAVIENSDKAPKIKENLLQRLADHIPRYASGEQLPLPTGYTQQQDMGKQIPPTQPELSNQDNEISGNGKGGR